jgi:predicted transcriptional regulator
MSDEEIFFELLANKYSRAILLRAYKKECSASQLSQELDMPLATVYRKLKLLEEARFIQHVKTIINLSGNEEKYFRCVINEVIVQISDMGFSVDFKKEARSDKIVRLWKRLAYPDKDIG